MSLMPGFQFLLSQILALVAQLAYVSHLVAIKLHFSLNLQEFFQSIFPILIYDVLPSDDIFEYIFSLYGIDDDPLT
jgi:hypothetical protein